jgi:hypothetical protein
LTASVASGNQSTEKLVIPKWEGGFSYANPVANANFAAGTGGTVNFAAGSGGQAFGYPGIDTNSVTMGWMDLSNPTPGTGATAGGIGIAYMDKQWSSG